MNKGTCQDWNVDHLIDLINMNISDKCDNKYLLIIIKIFTHTHTHITDEWIGKADDLFSIMTINCLSIYKQSNNNVAQKRKNYIIHENVLRFHTSSSLKWCLWWWWWWWWEKWLNYNNNDLSKDNRTSADLLRLIPSLMKVIYKIDIRLNIKPYDDGGWKTTEIFFPIMIIGQSSTIRVIN